MTFSKRRSKFLNFSLSNIFLHEISFFPKKFDFDEFDKKLNGSGFPPFNFMM
jgi:hypothetical protein